jgi:hypothetical protein
MANVTLSQHLTDEDINEIAVAFSQSIAVVWVTTAQLVVFGTVQSQLLAFLLTPSLITAVHTVLFVCCAYYCL